MMSPHNFGIRVLGVAGFTAAGTNQASAQPIAVQESVFTTVPLGTGCRLPSPSNYALTIYNQGANALLVYPAAGDKISPSGVNVPVSLAPGTSGVFSSFDNALFSPPRTWYQQSGGGNSSGVVQSTGDIHVSSAEILTAFSNPKVLIAAPGSGKQIKVIQVFYQYIFVTTPYTAPEQASTFIGLPGNGVPGDAGVTLTSGADVSSRSSSADGETLTANVENQPLFFGCATTDPTAGDGTLVVTVLYWI